MIHNSLKVLTYDFSFIIKVIGQEEPNEKMHRARSCDRVLERTSMQYSGEIRGDSYWHINVPQQEVPLSSVSRDFIGVSLYKHD